jgi:hypothetical protein
MTFWPPVRSISSRKNGHFCSHKCDLVRRTAEITYLLAGMRDDEQHAASKRNFEMNVVRFRPRQPTAFPQKRARDASTNNICELLDLSRYELRGRSRSALDSEKDDPDDFKHRMRANIMALIFLVALVGLAAADVLKLEAQISCPTKTAPCRLI